MDETTRDMLRLVEEEDVKFIRLVYCDMHGTPKNMAIMSSELRRAIEEGISFDASALDGFSPSAHADLFLVPDCQTISILPWRPAHERVMRIACDVRMPDGTLFEAYSRNVLRKAIKRASEMGFIVNIGTECEFTLFRLDERGRPTMEPIDDGGYNDISPLDRGENIRRQICLAIEEMGLSPESSHHECGRGQNEIDFRYSDALTAADNFQTFKMAVKSIAALNDTYASFMPKPLEDDCGNGLHVHLSLHKGGRNVFKGGGEHSRTGESFIAGILHAVPEMTAILNPIPNSYERFGAFRAPKYVTWSHENRFQLIRIPASAPDKVRAEVRSIDPSCNPYLAFALLIHAGLDGIEKGEKLEAAYDGNAYDIPGVPTAKLPETLGDALCLLRKSELAARAIPQKLLDEFLSCKDLEWNEYCMAKDGHQMELRRYFSIL